MLVVLRILSAAGILKDDSYDWYWSDCSVGQADVAVGDVDGVADSLQEPLAVEPRDSVLLHVLGAHTVVT